MVAAPVTNSKGLGSSTKIIIIVILMFCFSSVIGGVLWYFWNDIFPEEKGNSSGSGGSSRGPTGSSRGPTGSSGGPTGPGESKYTMIENFDNYNGGSYDIAYYNDLDECKRKCNEDSNCKLVLEDMDSKRCGLRNSLSSIYPHPNRKIHFK